MRREINKILEKIANGYINPENLPDSADAGIGATYITPFKTPGRGARRRRPTDNSYMGQLKSRIQDIRSAYPAQNRKYPPILTRPQVKNLQNSIDGTMRNKSVTMGDLRNLRSRQAALYANTLYAEGSDLNNQIRQNLISAGNENHRQYLKNKQIPQRSVMNPTGIRRELSPEEQETLRQMQNTMVYNPVNTPYPSVNTMYPRYNTLGLA